MTIFKDNQKSGLSSVVTVTVMSHTSGQKCAVVLVLEQKDMTSRALLSARCPSGSQCYTENEVHW